MNRAADSSRPASGRLVDPVSVLIVRYRDDPRLEACLEHLKRQEGVVLDVIIVENGSRRPASEPPEPWKSPGAAVRSVDSVIREANPGFAAAFNEAWARARGEWLVSVNPDCRLDPDAIRIARDALESDPDAGAVAFRLLRPGRELLDSAGIVVSPLFLRARDRGRGEVAAGRYPEAESVDAACLAGAMFRRSAVEAARDGAGEILDSRYFAYQEDVDLGWRLRRTHCRIRYEPGAVGEHDRGWREGRRREIPVELRRMSLRNRWFTIEKNIPWFAFLWRLPFLCAFELAFFLKLLLTEPRVVPAYWTAIAGTRESLSRRGLSHDPGGDRRHA